jgi:hypothetical protein
MRRFTRLHQRVLQEGRNLAAAVSRHFAHYNFCRVQTSLGLTKALQPGRTVVRQHHEYPNAPARRSSQMTSVAKTFLIAALLAVALLAAAARPAAAATPCWKALLNDWYDGRIDQTYASHCYTEAIAHLPSDVQTYSSAREDILRALQSAKSRARKLGKTVGPNTLIGPAPGTGGGGTTTTGGGGGGSEGNGPAGNDAHRHKGLSKVADKLNPGSASSLPVPLLVLGGLALLLVAGGGAGRAYKHVQTRRPGA